MRHKKDVRKLGRTKSHRKATIKNMVISFFQYNEIETTESKAKELQRTIEKIITLAKKGDLASYRRINTIVNHPPTLKQIKETAERYKDRNSGYTRIIKMPPRRGDNAEKAIIKLV
ncbi:MAG: 50S ribosomal protein L17 [Candidatus Omnitrophica bacterium]|nr:50S ribosomal protein L17 [Candidatus Omnitrophota bacterium]